MVVVVVLPPERPRLVVVVVGVLLVVVVVVVVGVLLVVVVVVGAPLVVVTFLALVDVPVDGDGFVAVVLAVIPAILMVSDRMLTPPPGRAFIFTPKPLVKKSIGTHKRSSLFSAVSPSLKGLPLITAVSEFCATLAISLPL